MKTCSRCQETKPYTDFPRDRTKKDGRKYHCKVCRNADKAKYRASEEGQAAIKEYRQKKKLSERARRYGLTKEQYLDMLLKQGGVCAICGEHPGGVLAIDHCHETNKVRGLLCKDCNTGLGNFKDNSEHLRKAARYLLSDCFY